MLDKILVLVLILLLPLAIFYTQKIAKQQPKPTGEYRLSEEGIQRLDQMLQQLQQKQANKPADQPAFQITTAFYSTQSGELQLAGLAPRSDIALLYALVNQSATPAASSSAVLGSEVSFRTIGVNPDKVFSLTLPIPTPVPYKLEIILQQGSHQSTLVYDFKQQKSFIY